MGEYNKSIEELSNEIEYLQISKMVKQADLQSRVPITSVGSNNPYHE